MTGRNAIGCFFVYWPCGKCVSGFCLDFGDDGSEQSAGPMLADSLRTGCKVSYTTDLHDVRISRCKCSSTATPGSTP